jgi:tetratricopeptide (TPR) repeat protein
MIEQPDVTAPAGFPIASLRLTLEAVRVAQEAARLRARQQTRQARLGFALLLGAAGFAVVGLGPRVSRWWHGRAHAATLPRASTIAPPPAAPARPTAEARPFAPQPAPVAAPAATLARAGDVAAPTEGCDTGAIRTAPWRLSPEACARAFEADPKNAALALAVAQAQHAHARLAEGAEWARRALALDPNAAEAYVIIARADKEAGRPEEARAAYQHYLELAPRGWHRAEARAALRPAR